MTERHDYIYGEPAISVVSENYQCKPLCASGIVDADRHWSIFSWIDSAGKVQCEGSPSFFPNDLAGELDAEGDRLVSRWFSVAYQTRNLAILAMADAMTKALKKDGRFKNDNRLDNLIEELEEDFIIAQVQPTAENGIPNWIGKYESLIPYDKIDSFDSRMLQICCKAFFHMKTNWKDFFTSTYEEMTSNFTGLVPVGNGVVARFKNGEPQATIELCGLVFKQDSNLSDAASAIPSCGTVVDNCGLDNFLVGGRQYKFLGKTEKFGKEYYLVECDGGEMKWVGSERFAICGAR